MSDQLPTEEDLLKLSKRGRVCYAVRCAMRVMHLTEPRPDIRYESFVCIEAATRWCLAPDKNAADDAAEEAYETAQHVAHEVDDPSYGRGYPARDRGIDITAADVAASAAAEAASAAADAAYFANDANTAVVCAFTADGTNAAYVHTITGYVNAAYTAAGATARVAARADYDKLLELTGHQVGQLGDPIDPGEDGLLGKLWPETE
jgi:hypothetical protein